ncbi:MAG: amino acid ABC transporter permease [Rhizobacter sp.]
MQYDFDWSFLLKPQFVGMLTDGVALTLAMAVCSGVLSFVLGSGIAVARVWPLFWIRVPANTLVEVVRNIPALFWILFFYFVFPELLPSSWGQALHEWPRYAFVAGVMGLAVDNGAYLSDILRNGMAKVSRGQRDAAASCGMSIWQECFSILCPQSLRAMMPAIANRMIHNFKNTSLCVAIALPELTWAAQQIESITFKGLEVTLVATLAYASISLLLAFGLSCCFRDRKETGGINQREVKTDALR